MTDLKERLDRLVDGEDFAPLTPGPVLERGRRTLRRRRLVTAVAAAAVVVVGTLAVSTAVRYVQQPDLEFGDPAGRRPATGGVAPEDADLVISRSGEADVTITGFGWPLEEMDPDDISQRDGESMCLPMLEQAAPEVPASAWHHSQAWVDRFPSRATFPTTIEAEHDGRSYDVTCALPGDYVPARRPDLSRVPTGADPAAVLEQCSYLSHVDFAGWSIAAVAPGAGGTIAALASPDGDIASCVLSAGRAGRSVQVSELPEPPDAEDSIVYHEAGRSVLVAGRAPDGAVRIDLQVASSTEQTGVTDGLFAVTAEASRSDPTVRLTAFDRDGNELASYSTTTYGPGGSLLPADCFYSLETNNDGC